jgi:hypothetical protein
MQQADYSSRLCHIRTPSVRPLRQVQDTCRANRFSSVAPPRAHRGVTFAILSYFSSAYAGDVSAKCNTTSVRRMLGRGRAGLRRSRVGAAFSHASDVAWSGDSCARTRSRCPARFAGVVPSHRRNTGASRPRATLLFHSPQRTLKPAAHSRSFTLRSPSLCPVPESFA